MVRHLRGRDQALVAAGWSPAEAEWLALVCLHSGIFIQPQLSEYRGCSHRMQAGRVVQSWARQGVATPQVWPADQRYRVYHITNRGLYRALHAEDIRHRRVAGAGVFRRRLLSFDYVIDHVDRDWLPTEPEKVRYFVEGLGIDEATLPHRDYGNRWGRTRRYFPVKLPVSASSGQVTFVYVDSEDETTEALREWGATHDALWRSLRDRDLKIQVVVVGSSQAALLRAAPVLEGWTHASMPVVARRELGELRAAIRKLNRRRLEEHGGLNGALRRCAALEAAAAGPAMAACDEYAVWFSDRVAGMVPSP